jgi:predicted membrane metal-binding protein
MKRTWIVLFAVLVVAALALAACGQQAPQTVVVTQVVEKPGGTVVVTQIVEATPAPPQPKEFKSPHPDTLVIATIGDAEKPGPGVGL